MSNETILNQMLQVRPMTEADLPRVAALLVQSFHLYPPGGEGVMPLVQFGLQEDLRQRLKGKGYLCLVACRGQELIGTVEISQRLPWLWQMGTKPYAYLANLAVRSDVRQQGIAKALLAQAEMQVQQWHCQDLYLHVMEDNFLARQLYLKAGYYIHQVENSWSSWLALPRRLFLHKRLPHFSG
jgi:ribosomal protein S18 acetylase RimI-like enzyme